MDTSFWIGLALSVPVGIIINLFTPALSTWLASRNARFAKARQKKQHERLAYAKKLYDNPFAYSAFLHQVNVRLVTYLVFLTISVNGPFILPVVFIGLGVDIASFGQIAGITAVVLTTALAVLFMNTRRRSNEVTRAASTFWSEDNEEKSRIE
jgi:hypothetical protein